MRAVFGREFGAYFKSVTGYVFGGLLLLSVGLYTVLLCLDGGSPQFEAVLAEAPVVFIVIVPILTMRSIADERRQRTDQLLYALPLGMTRVVLGKYLAMMAVVLMPMAVVCGMPLLLRGLGPVNLAAAYSAVIGFTMLAAALVVMGMVVSSLTDNVAVAAGLCFLVMLLNYFLSSLAAFIPPAPRWSLLSLSAVLAATGLVLWRWTRNAPFSAGCFLAAEAVLLVLYRLFPAGFAGRFAIILRHLSLFQRYALFRHAVLDLGAVVYYLSVCVLCLFMTVQSLEKRRWS